MLRKIKKLLFPSRYLLKDLNGIAREYKGVLIDQHRQNQTEIDSIQARLREILVEQRKNRFFNSPSVREHLAHLFSPLEVAAEEISYTLQLAVRQLDFKIENHDLNRPVICTVALGEAYQRKVAPCLQSQRDYCARHGYAYVELTTPPDVMLRAAAWYKISLVYALLKKGYQNVFYIDADAMITNPAITMEPFFASLDESNKNFLVTVDDSGINTGVFFVKNGPPMLRLLDLIWSYDVDPENGTWEQNALRELLENYNVLQRIILIEVKPKTFNSFPKERINFFSNLNKQVNSWTPGDFICHFSGLRSPDLEKLIEAYLKA